MQPLRNQHSRGLLTCDGARGLAAPTDATYSPLGGWRQWYPAHDAGLG